MDMDTDTDTKLYGDSHILPAIVRKKPNIFITGTPGVGKTSLAKLLMQKIEGMHYINVDDYVTDKTIYEKWGGLFNLSDDDKDSIIKQLEPKMALGGNIVDFHTSYFFPKHWFDLILILRCSKKVLRDRLTAFGYTKEKIDEIVGYELHEFSKEDVHSRYKKEIFMEFRTEQNYDMYKNINAVIEFLFKWDNTQED